LYSAPSTEVDRYPHEKDPDMSLPTAVRHDFDLAQRAAGVPLLWLHLGADTLWLVREGDAQGADSMSLAWTGGSATLMTDHSLVRGLAQTEASLSLEWVEMLFQRLASGALGDPSALKGLPAGRESAATLLILRELMHHLKFNEVVVAPASPAAPLP
jgi:hypothetical protein